MSDPTPMTTTDAMTDRSEAEARNQTKLSEREIAALIGELEATGDVRVLRRLVPLPPYRRGPEDSLRCAIVVDTETTGLVIPGTEPDGARPSEIVSLAMVALAYDPADGTIKGSLGRFHAYREPSHPIPPAATKIHGITDDDVRGHTIAPDEVAGFITRSSTLVRCIAAESKDGDRLPLMIAHNARFDRHMLEFHFPDAVTDLPWACSQTQVPWSDHGYEGTKLFYLGVHASFYYGARHSALADADAVVELLRQPLDGRSAMSHLCEAARRHTYKLAVSTRYDTAIIFALKERGYRWHAGTAAQAKAWVWEGDEDGFAAEIAYLQQANFNETRTVIRLGPFDRYSRRS